jgi:zinc protease
MSIRTLAVAIAVGLVVSTPGGVRAEGDGGVFPYPTHVETLDNGLKVVVVPMHGSGLVSYWTVVRTGSRDEYEPNRTGFAHFFEHMMFRGTERFPGDEYNRILTELGADSNAFTSNDLTAYHLSVAASDLERVMDIESDRFRNLDYPKADFQTEAGAVYGEYRKNRASWYFTIYEAVQQAAFDVHTYGHTAMGFVEDIKIMPTLYDYSRSFFDRYYRPENCVLVIAGDVDPTSTVELAREYYAEWEPGYVAPKVQPEPEQTAERSIDVTYPGRTLPVLWLAYKADAFDPTDRVYAAGDLLADLAFGETSEIYRDLVLERQAVEFLTASAPMSRDPGLYSIVARVKDPEQVGAVRERIEEVLARYRDELPDATRLADLKSRMRYSFLMNLDTPDAVTRTLARIVALTGGVEAVDTLYATYEQVTPEDVREAARRYFQDRGRTVAILRGDAR